MERTLNFVSWNTCGIKTKLPTLLEKFNTLDAEIVFLQETHVGPKCYSVLENVSGWRVYFTVHKPNSKGVAILIKNGENGEEAFEYICHDEDNSGGYIVLFCRLYGELFTLVNVYKHKHDSEVLYRLKDYLREVAEGVLVIGGDFNTVLDPEFDRKPTAVQAEQLELSDLDKFMNSLHITDTWSHLHPTDEDYTRSQGDSYSRLDMFFMQEDDMDRMISCEINKIANEPKISDHHPLILTLRVQQQDGDKVPNVASMLKDFGHSEEPDRRSDKINGAEILSAIKSLTDSGEQRPDGLSVDDYKMFCSPLSEILKINYNLMVKNKYVPKIFKRSECIDGRYMFNVDYLVFCLILSERLRVFLTRPNGKMKKEKLPKRPILSYLQVTFENLPHTVQWSLLKKGLKLKHAPARDFSILKTLLPEGSKFSKRLCKGCPLTRPIFTLALKQLEEKIKNINYSTKMCNFRPVLLVHLDNDSCEAIEELIRQFEIKYGINLKKARKKERKKERRKKVTILSL